MNAPTASGRAVLFDLYGTLIDIRTDEDDPRVYATLADYLAYRRIFITAAELARQYRARVRRHLDSSTERFPEVDVATVFHEIIAAHRQDGNAGGDTLDAVTLSALFRTLTRRQFATFPGVHAALERLRARYCLGLVSDAQWVFTDPELEMTGLGAFFPVRILSSRVGVRKPDPRPFLEAVRALGATPAASLYVGDNPARDLVGARNAGMRCILFGGATGDYHGVVPAASFQTYADLEAIVDQVFDADARATGSGKSQQTAGSPGE